MQELYLSKKQLPFVIVIEKMETELKKSKKICFQNFVNKCHENWKKIKNLPTHCLITCKTKNQISRSLLKASELIENWSKLIRKLDQRLIRNLCHLKSLFCLFSSLRKIMHFYKSFLWSQKNHFGVSKKNKFGVLSIT